MRMERETVSFDTPSGLKIVADVVGDGRRGGVLLAHGAGQTRHSWASTAQRLAERGWRTISIDLRGHGDSEWSPEGAYSNRDFADDIGAVAATFDNKPALIGASLGGLAGLGLEALAAPGTFSSITLVDIIPNPNPDGSARVLGFMGANLEHGFESLEAAADSIAAYMPHRTRPSDLSGLQKNLRLGADGRYRWHWDPKFMSGIRAPRPVVFTQEQADAAYRGIEIPIHVIRGRMSELVSQDAALAFVASLKNGSFSDVAEAGHMVAGDRNDAFLQAVLAFLDKQG
jgi:pimeloyl-ACP methyl ester carboxylesterase